MSEGVAIAGPARIRPREVRCVIEHLHRDLAVAEDACAGRFTLAGITCDLGLEPDWLAADLPDDEEWRIEWTKFYYGLDLAHAFATTGEQRFLEAWERLVRSYLRTVPVGVDSSDVAARRVQNWVYAWTAFARADRFDGLSDGLEQELLERLKTQTHHICDNLTAERNHRTLELYALIVVALAFPQIDPAGDLVCVGLREIHRNLLADIRADGVHREHSTHYHVIALRSFLGARDNLRRFGYELPPGYDLHLSRACDFAMHCQRPDGLIPALSDSDNGAYADVLALGADVLDRPDLRYVATRGTAGVAPSDRLAAFPDGGYWVQRSGWGDDDRAFGDASYLIFDCGPVGDGGHGHYDLLSFEAMSAGRPLVVDPGRHTYAEQTPNLRHAFKGTAAHNTVVVDGLDQVPYRRGKPRKDTHPQARFVERLSAPGLDILDGEARTTVYDAVHRRQIVFVADSYWLIVDALSAQTPHRYSLRFHLDQSAQQQVAVDGDGSGWVVRAPGLALVSVGGARPSVEQGWVSPEYGIKHPAPVISMERGNVMATTFETLLIARSASEPTPTIDFAWTPGGWTARITDGEICDTVAWRERAEVLGIDAIRGAGRAAWTRTRDAHQIGASVVEDAAGWRAWDGATGTRTGRGGAS
jgi:Heparinase II/III-like protein/Heparinase II/III N-terminus